MSTPHITELRQQLLDTLKDLRNRENPMEPDRARAVAQVASVLVETAKVEVDFIKATNADGSTFIGEVRQQQPALPPASGYTQGEVTREPGRTVHKLRG